MTAPIYDRIGAGYSVVRRPDPRIGRLIFGALGDAGSVLNVGAGTGAYEPTDRDVMAVEPSSVMIAQRAGTAAPVVRASAEHLPFPDDSFDAVMALISDHNWTDRDQGLREMRRVARRRVLLFNSDPGAADLFWLNTEYLPEFLDLIPVAYRGPDAWKASLEQALGDVELRPVPIPHDCSDGFYPAYWRRPAAYLDPEVRAGVSVFSKVSAAAVARAVEQLDADLESGAWEKRHRDLLELDELDLGLRIVGCDLAQS